MFWLNMSGNVLTIRKGKCWGNRLGKILRLQYDRILKPGQTRSCHKRQKHHCAGKGIS